MTFEQCIIDFLNRGNEKLINDVHEFFRHRQPKTRKAKVVVAKDDDHIYYVETEIALP